MTPITTNPIRWGILGCGHIARQFATGLQALPTAKIMAVGSRSQETADAFGDAFGAAKRHAGYQALAADPDVDVIYVATPHPYHKANTLLCLEHGKPVICEKPFTVNVKEAEEVVRFAREKDLFLMEAMWTRYFPAMFHVRKLIADGVIGEPRMIQADFGFRAEVNPKGRLFDLNLAGGGLLDVGIYPLSLSSMIFGTPNQVTGVAHLGETGVDEQAGMVLGHPGGQISILSTGVRTDTPHEAFILGTDGHIKIHAPWWKPKDLTIKSGSKTEDISISYESVGMNYEAQEVMDCLRLGKNESALMPLDETLSLMRTMDTLRAQWGLKYPME